MKRNFFIATLTIIMNIMNIFSSDGQSYNELWNNVSDLKQKDMPRKVIDEAQKIYDKAQKEKNFPHLAKAWITIVETKCDLDPDSFRIANFPPFPHKGLVEDAVYNAVMGSAYLAMADSHISDFDEETQNEYSAKGTIKKQTYYGTEEDPPLDINGRPVPGTVFVWIVDTKQSLRQSAHINFEI